jgi:hypothetical protein
MKAILKFNLDEPEDALSFARANKGQDYFLALWDIGEQLRSWEKYGHPFKDADDALSQIRKDFYRVMNHFNINLDEA